MELLIVCSVLLEKIWSAWWGFAQMAVGINIDLLPDSSQLDRFRVAVTTWSLRPSCSFNCTSDADRGEDGDEEANDNMRRRWGHDWWLGIFLVHPPDRSMARGYAHHHTTVEGVYLAMHCPELHCRALQRRSDQRVLMLLPRPRAHCLTIESRRP